ncbi:MULTISPECIES: hypothetical protein [unclassified Coleofasciculus]|uniref:hypothetical protein n=1 Tax=unclassified Coleofasciculus TaxID=2692782 RepID=UPI00187E5E25|nr:MULTISPECIES: hypothetical protein [unclassified Coleofasciculus]MBE9127742.1 hypothetical protein [Coleofasciculus sp. LEGE 07081]MBE9150710.1 hypothetical protein [Coleofasciculus sp. LEGE 07092]
MPHNNQPLRLHLNHYRSYIAISYEDMEVGFCTPEFAAKIVETFNEHERLLEDNETVNKAFKLACLELLRQTGVNANQLNRRMKDYLDKAKRPEHGTRALAFMLRERQQELDVSNREFARFCYSYKLSPQELKGVFEGKDIPDSQLKALARILGKSIEELMEIRDGFSDTELNRLARILGTSNEELSKVFKG